MTITPRKKLILLSAFFSIVFSIALVCAYFFYAMRKSSTPEERRTFLYTYQIGIECWSLAISVDQVPPTDLEQLPNWLYSMPEVLPRSEESKGGEKLLRSGVDIWGSPLHVDFSAERVWKLWSSGPNQMNEDGAGDDIGVKIDFGSESEEFPKTIQFLRRVQL